MGRYGARADMIVHEEQPFNAESGLAALAEPLTPTNAFYVRGHGDVPDIDPTAWRMRVHGAVEMTWNSPSRLCTRRSRSAR
jgi:sulfite oxidase